MDTRISPVRFIPTNPDYPLIIVSNSDKWAGSPADNPYQIYPLLSDRQDGLIADLTVGHRSVEPGWAKGRPAAKN